MAKLSARGRTELARYERTGRHEAANGGLSYDWRIQYAFMSDDNVLRKVVPGRWGIVKLKAGVTQAQYAEALRKLGARLISGTDIAPEKRLDTTSAI